MKIAHLILCHAYPEQLSRLVARLAHEDADFYIHVDKKADFALFQSLSKIPNLKFIENRVKVNWAGYSQVQAIVNSLKEILASGVNYGYVNLLSAQDYPIKSTKEIHDFFAGDPGKAFMHTLSVKNEWREALPRLTKYHLADHHFPGRHTAAKMMNSMLPVRKLPGNAEPVGRSSWFTVAPVHARYIIDYLDKHPAFVRFFKLSWGADEIVFQTILYNSAFKKDMVNDNLLYVDWSEGKPNPKVLTMADADALKNSDKLFARKFNTSTDDKILDYLDSITS